MFDDIEKKIESKKNPKINKELKPTGFASLIPAEVEKLRGKWIKPKKQTSAPNSEFDQRMTHLHEKGRRRGRRYSVIGIVGSIAISGVVLVVGYYMFSEIKSLTVEIDQKEQSINRTFNLVEDPDNICSGDYCCLAALKKINRYDLKQATLESDCPSGHKLTGLDCDSTLTWCEFDSLALSQDINNYQISVADWHKFRNESYGYEIDLPAQWQAYSENDGSIVATSPKNFPNQALVMTGMPPELDFQIEVVAKIDPAGYQKAFLAGATTSHDVIVSSGQTGRVLTLSGKVFFLLSAGSNMLKVVSVEDFSYNDKIFKSFVLLKASQLNTVRVDTDSDGLYDDEEEKYGTKIDEADTDSDGYSDGEEVAGGFNPNGPGLLNQ